MNENPGGTPNPLGSTPVTNPMPAQPIAPVPAPAPAPTPSSVPTPTTNPIGRPMEQATPSIVEAPAKKKKTGLIAGIIAAVVVLLIGGVAAALVMMLNQPDPVTAAMNKIMSGNAPTNVAIDGNINIAINDETSPITSVNIDLKSSGITSSMINDSKAVVTAEIRNVGELSVEFDEVYAGNGDLYFKIDGVTNALEDSGLLYLLNSSSQVDCSGGSLDCLNKEVSTNCIDGVGTNCLSENEYIFDGGQNILDEETITYFSSLLNVIEVIDGEWLKISVDQLNMVSGGMTADSNTSCITDLISEVNTNSNSAAELYRKNPFISSTNKDVALNSKNYPVYKVSIDSEKFANYVNSIKNANLSSNLYSCLGWDNNVQISTDDVAEIVNTMPTIYTEVDNDNNFSRLYLVSDLNDGEGTMTIDLGFSYPTNVDVSEPVEYKDFSEIITQIMMGVFDLDNDYQGWVDCQPPLSDKEAARCAELEESGYPYIAY